MKMLLIPNTTGNVGEIRRTCVLCGQPHIVDYRAPSLDRKSTPSPAPIQRSPEK